MALLVLVVCIPLDGFGQTVSRPPAGTGGLTASWEWAVAQSSARSAEISAIVWTIDSEGTNWRWGHQGSPLSEILGVSAEAESVAIVAVMNRGEVELLHTQDFEWPLRRDVSRVLFLGQASQSESYELVSKIDLASAELQRARLHGAAVHREVPAAGTLILDALAASSRDLRKAAAYAWAQFGGEEALPRLTALAVDDRDEDVAKAAAYAIGSVDAIASVDALVEVLDASTRREIRKAAAYSLGNHGSPEARAVLIRLIRTEQ